MERIVLKSASQMFNIIDEVARIEKAIATPLTSSQVPIARIENEECRWLDPRLVYLIASGFQLDAVKHSSVICSLVVQVSKFISENNGRCQCATVDVVYSQINGELAMVLNK